MRGAIIGDIVGSSREFGPRVTDRDFDLFPLYSDFTDDSVLTIAVYDSLKNNIPYEESFIKWVTKYTNKGYGGWFWTWITSKEKKPYGSKGNGAAMRVSPVGWLFDTEGDILREAKKTADVTHNTTEGVASAQAVAMCIYLARNKKNKNEIKEYIEKKFGYNLGRSLIEVLRDYKVNELAKGTVEESIICFLSADSFEQTIRNAISLGGDTDTLACIAGSIAEAYYGLDEKIWSKAKRYLTDEILELLGEFDSSIEDVYIDVEGVILNENGEQMPYLKEFLTLIFSMSENVYWLSKYSKDGDTLKVLEYLDGKVDKEVLEMLKNVKGKKWDLFRTESIDFLRRFLWFSGKVGRNQYVKLEILHKDHNLIVVENNLEEIIELFKKE